MSPYYQAWVGAYVTKRHDGTLPQDLTKWAKQVTELDQRSWPAAMGDPQPLAESAAPTSVGKVVFDGRTLELWHGTMRSHSDLSETSDTPLATLVGMPPNAGRLLCVLVRGRSTSVRRRLCGCRTFS